MTGDFEREQGRILSLTKGGGCYYPSVRLLMHPFSTRLTYVCARLNIHPNVVSAGYILFSIFALRSFWTEVYLTALVCYWVRVVLDYTDGTLARYTSRVSEFGARLDMVVDYIFFPVLWVLFALRASSPASGVLTVTAALAYVVVVTGYVLPRLKSLTRREPVKQYLMDRGVIIGFACFGVFEFWSLVFFAVGAPREYYVVLPGLMLLDLTYRVYEVARFRPRPVSRVKVAKGTACRF